MAKRFTLWTIPLLLVAAGCAVTGPPTPPPSATSLVMATPTLPSADVAKEEPSHLFAHGAALYQQGNWQEASDLFGKAASSYPLLRDYALFYEADSLGRLKRSDAAILLYNKLLREYPTSPLVRRAEISRADLLGDAGDPNTARASFQEFVSHYKKGSDVLHARFCAALLAEQAGDPQRAAEELRLFWLTSPEAVDAAEANRQLQRLASTGVTLPPPSAEELLERGRLLISRRRFLSAAETLRQIPAESRTGTFGNTVTLTLGRALLEGRRPQEAFALLSPLDAATLTAEQKRERQELLARAAGRTGKDDEAVRLYLELAKDPHAERQGEFLLQAALVRKGEGKGDEARLLLRRLLDASPAAELRDRALWEMGWLAYLGGDLSGAADSFQLLLHGGDRERATYWLARALERDGKHDESVELFATLGKEFPLGYYHLIHRADGAINPPPVATLEDRELAGFFPKTDKGERILALSAAGLSLDARNELAALRGKSDATVTSSELTRIALEIGDYRSALRLNPRQGAQSITEANLALWGVNYPRPYWDEVRENARTTGLPPEFILSVIRAESTFDPDVESPAGAIGLMQLMPATARILLSKEDHRPLETILRTPDLNIRLGSRHLKDLVTSYRGNLIHATAAYNGGSGNVNRWLSRFGSLADDELVEAIPFNETREYVKKVLTTKALYRILYQPTAVAEIDTSPSAPLK